MTPLAIVLIPLGTARFAISCRAGINQPVWSAGQKLASASVLQARGAC